MYTCPSCVCPWRTEVRTSGTEVKDIESPHGYWELNPDPFEEQPVF